MTTDSVKEKIIISVTESKTAYIPIENSHITICQRCLLCDNTQEFINGHAPSPHPWVCNECLEAIAFIKKFKANY
jgi:hypothetical protein